LASCGSWRCVWPLASCVAVGKLWQLAICGSWRSVWPLASCVAVGDLYTISELCGRWQAIYRWRAVWQLAICIPLASCVAVGKPYTAGELCGCWRAVWQVASCVVFEGSLVFGRCLGPPAACVFGPSVRMGRRSCDPLPSIINISSQKILVNKSDFTRHSWEVGRVGYGV
jgi:hypothetical protein